MVGSRFLQVVDLLVGVVVISAGLASMRSGRVARLMLLVGATWLVGSVFSAAVFLHRGPLVQLHLTYPTGHARRRYVTVVIGAAYVLGVVEAFVPAAALTLALALLVAAAAIDVFVRTTGPARKAGRRSPWHSRSWSPQRRSTSSCAPRAPPARRDARPWGQPSGSPRC
ncbi:hypothetical protein ASD90_21845 [Terrabacter sp. Root181]|nr:hypothetical protein ASD90_21845 [Terrabacter sp. Root181]